MWDYFENFLQKCSLKNQSFHRMTVKVEDISCITSQIMWMKSVWSFYAYRDIASEYLHIDVSFIRVLLSFGVTVQIGDKRSYSVWLKSQVTHYYRQFH